MKIVHIINSLRKGGAEGNLYRLCKMHKENYKKQIEVTIITLISNGYFENKLKRKGIKVISLCFKNNNKIIDLIKKLFLLRTLIRKIDPDFIQSWMYHSNFISIFIPKIFYKKLYWNIRHSELNLNISKKKTIFLSFICGILSRYIPKKIIYCSSKSIFFHQKFHLYQKEKSTLIHNGYSDQTYYKSSKLRKHFRLNNKINNKDILVGFAGRYAKQKNIQSMLIAFSKIIKKHHIYLCMAGKNLDFDNKELLNSISNLNLEKNVILLKDQKNLLEFYNGIDFLLLPSHSESFPNVVAESMLCATPVLSSNAGCAKEIIDKFGFVMTDNNEKSIYRHLLKVLRFFKYNKKKWRDIKKNAQLKIIENYSVEQMANMYLKTWTL